ncbi:MAG: hypothetical protein PHF31_06200 [Methylobacter sp.]|nr:hypothetical protein [Methylobacter sp.]
MTLKKRGLGRGLEALLADVSAKEEKHQPQTMQSGDYQPAKDVSQDEVKIMPMAIDDCMAATASGGLATFPPSTEVKSGGGAVSEEVDGRMALVVALFKNIQREHLILQEEAEVLRKLIEEFESIVRADLS